MYTLHVTLSNTHSVKSIDPLIKVAAATRADVVCHIAVVPAVLVRGDAIDFQFTDSIPNRITYELVHKGHAQFQYMLG